MNANPTLDAIVVGSGHNGLIAANYLARAGRRVLVLEARSVAGGQLVAADDAQCFAVSPLHASSQLRPIVVRELGLERYGLAETAGTAPYVALLPEGGTLALSSVPEDPATLAAIRRLSDHDARRWPEFVAFMDTAAAFLDAAYATPMPRVAGLNWRDGLPLASLGWRLRRLGREDMFRVLRTFSMTALEFAEEWFESEPLRAAIGALAVHGLTLGAMSAGGGFNAVHQWWLRGGLAHRPGVAPAKIVDALVQALQAGGGQLRLDAPVTRILVERQRVLGVELDNGEQIHAPLVVSAADPRRTLLGLVGAPELPPEFAWHVRSIRMRGSVAKVHLLTDGRHDLPAGTLCVAPSLRSLEQAWDDAKYGQLSQRPYLEVTTSEGRGEGNVVSIHYQFAPYALRVGDWDALRGTLERVAIDSLAERFPALRDSVRAVRSITPLDLERDWHLTEGDVNHGQLIIDQLFLVRPLPGWSDHRTPVDGLWLCGSGTHGGGGISGHAGRNAARALLRK